MLLYQESCPRDLGAGHSRVVRGDQRPWCSMLGINQDSIRWGIFVDMEPAATPFRRSAVTGFFIALPPCLRAIFGVFSSRGAAFNIVAERRLGLVDSVT